MIEQQWWPKREDWPAFPPENDGDRYWPEQALALLILEDVVVAVNSGECGITVQVNCNDLFYWACADCEPLPLIGFGKETEAPFWELYDMYRTRGAADEWVCLRRQMRPQYCIEQGMKRDGQWTEALEALPVRETGLGNPKIEPRPQSGT